MKNQALVFLKDKSKKLKCRLLQFLFGALRVNLFALRRSKSLHKLKKFLYGSDIVLSKLTFSKHYTEC